MLSGRAPRRVRRGQRIRIAIRTRIVRGPLRTIRFSVRVPSDLRPGLRRLRLSGTEVDDGGGDILDIAFEGEDEAEGDDIGPRSLRALVREIEGIARFDGVKASFGGGRPATRFTDPRLRLSGRISIPVRVVAPRRPARRPRAH